MGLTKDYIQLLFSGSLIFWAPLHKTIVALQLMVSLQSMVTVIDFLTLIGYGAVLLC